MGTSSSIIAEILQNINLQKQFCLDTEEVSVALNKGYVKTIVINYILCFLFLMQDLINFEEEKQTKFEKKAKCTLMVSLIYAD